MTELIQIQTTLESQEEATTLINLLLKNRLVACIHLMESQSHYVWNGEAVNKQEYVLNMKTQASLFSSIQDLFGIHHPYQTPELIALPIIEASASYAAWVKESTHTT